MNKIMLATCVAALLAGCASSDPYTRRIEADQARAEKAAERALDKAPDWMGKVPTSENAVYAAGTATSPDMNMADEKAKIMALGKICITAGGEIDNQSRVFQTDNPGGTTNGSSELVVRSMCRAVDVTGAELVDVKRITDNGQFRSYVLMSLPMGDANILKKNKQNFILQQQATQAADSKFRNLGQ